MSFTKALTFYIKACTYRKEVLNQFRIITFLWSIGNKDCSSSFIFKRQAT